MSDPDDDTVDVLGIPCDDQPTVAGYELLFVSARNPTYINAGSFTVT